jgi:hypothetical protein
MYAMPTSFLNPHRRGATPMPRPKTELTKSGKAVGVRLTKSEYEEYERLGKGKWLRKYLQKSKDKRKVEEVNHE